VSKSRPTGKKSELIDAARRLQEALSAYQDKAEEFGAMRLNTQKTIERAAETLTQIAALEQVMVTDLNGLVAAIGGLRDRQQQQAQLVEQRAGELVGRRQVLESLLGDLVGLTDDVKGVRQLLHAVEGEAGAGPDVVDVSTVVARISALGDRARSFAELAKERDFPELAAQGHALGQQLDAVAGRAQHLQARPRNLS
jgi:hypothetical protein